MDAVNLCLHAEAGYFRQLFADLAESSHLWCIVRVIGPDGQPIDLVAPEVQRRLYEAARDTSIGVEVLKWMQEREDRIRALQEEADVLRRQIERQGPRVM